MEQASGFFRFLLFAGGFFFLIRFVYRRYKNRGYFGNDVTREEDIREIALIDKRIRDLVLEAMEKGKNCLDIVKILAVTKYESRKYPLERAFRNRLSIRARAVTLSCLRSGFAISKGFVSKYPTARIVLARECFREALRLCSNCSEYTLGNVNSAQCPVYLFFVKNSVNKGAK